MIQPLQISSRGGLSAIIISHPHFYTTHLTWARTFACPIYTHGADSTWLNRSDDVFPPRRRLIDSPTQEIVKGVTAIRVGGHFPGSLVLHWDQAGKDDDDDDDADREGKAEGKKGWLGIADSFVTVPVSVFHLFTSTLSFPPSSPSPPRRKTDEITITKSPRITPHSTAPTQQKQRHMPSCGASRT